MNYLPLLASDNAEIVATIVVIAVAVILMSFVILALAIGAYYYKTQKEQPAKKPTQAKQPAPQPAKQQPAKEQAAQQTAQRQEESEKDFEDPFEAELNEIFEGQENIFEETRESVLAETQEEVAVAAAVEEPEQPEPVVIYKLYIPRGKPQLEYHAPLMLPAACEPLLVGGGVQPAISQRAESVRAQEPDVEELMLKESIALAVAAAPRHIRINKATVAAWLTENYGTEIQLNRRKDRTSTGLPLADTHYVIKKGKSRCFIYVYDFDEERSMLLLKADDITATEIIGQYPSIKKSLFPKSSKEKWYTLIPNIGFNSDGEIYDIIALIIARLLGDDSVHLKPRAEQPVEIAEEELPPEQDDVEAAAKGVTLKESIALANAMARMKINKNTVAVWLTEKYGDEIIINRRENRIKTGLPLADTHYVMRNGKKECFIYVYELDNDKSFILLKTDGVTASEIAEKDPLFMKSRFPKSKYEQWYTLIPDKYYKNEKEVFDVIELVLSRFMGNDESKVLYDMVYAKRRGRRKPGKKFAVNCDTIAKNYRAGETVNIENLKKKGIVPKTAKQIKILARGAIEKSFTVIADDFSADAILFISKAGGKPILTD